MILQAPVAVPVPIVVVCGAAGAGKTRAISRWVAQAPAGERRAVLSNDPHAPARRHAAFGGAPMFEVAGGCACCVAGAALRTMLLRAIASGPWHLLLLEASGAAVPAALVDALRAPSLAQVVHVLGVVTLVDATRAASWLDAPGALAARAQLDGADVVVVNRLDAAGDAAAGAALCRRLAEGPFGGRDVRVAHDAGPTWDEVAHALARAHAHGGHATPEGVAFHREDGGALVVSWRWPAQRVFERRAVRQACASVAGVHGLSHAQGAWRTAREWYGFELLAGGASWAPTAWRRDSRLECAFAGTPPRGVLDEIGAALSAAIVVPA